MDPLGTLITWAAPYGAAGLLAIAFAERLAPILPSYAVLVAVGISAAAGAWSVGTALVATTVGSVVGCLLIYALCARIGEARSAAFLVRFARWFGVSSERMQSVLVDLRRRRGLLSFGAQLIPTVRLVAPGVAGFLNFGVRPFLLASLIGVALWNALFIGVGYFAPLFIKPGNATVFALKVLGALVLCELLVFFAWNRLRRSRVA